MFSKIIKAIVRPLKHQASDFFPLSPALPLPEGVSEQQLFDFVTSVRVQDAPDEELHVYATNDFRRFVYTWGLARDLKGKCLELGANPYFTSMLLKTFSELELSFANYFGVQNSTENEENSQNVSLNDFNGTGVRTEKLTFKHFNVEQDLFPYSDSEFDLVIFAEIIEHMLNDPCKVLREIKRVLKPDGVLILTTPNVARLENVARMISGANIYDPYSGYGPYGRHNREYNRHELDMLLRFEGFEPTHCFTADVHYNAAQNYFPLESLGQMLRFRQHDLGQYIFLRANAQNQASIKRPSWLYRSYPSSELS